MSVYKVFVKDGEDEKGKYKLYREHERYYSKWDSESDVKEKTSTQEVKEYESGEVERKYIFWW